MASIIDTTRIVDLPTKASLSEGDVFVVDNENGATSKIPATAVSGSSTAGLVAEEYRDSKTYKVGEYCIHVEAGIPKFYKCTTAIDTAEAWTPAHWEGTDAGTEITDLNQNLTVKSGTITSTFTTLDLMYCERTGNVVSFSIRFSGGSVPHGSPLFTLPEGFRPSAPKYIVNSGRMTIGGSSQASTLLRVETNGGIYQEYSTSATTNGYLQGMFIV